MQNLRKLNIFQLYKRLPFIVYKSAYLIPQRPFPSKQPEIYTDIAEQLLVSNPIVNFTRKDITQTDQIEPASGSSSKLSISSSYEELLAEYISTYILPTFKTKKIEVALKLYLEQNGKALKKNQENKISIHAVSKHFYSLSLEERWPYLTKAESIIAQIDRKVQIYEELFKIPEPKYMSPKQLYSFEAKKDRKKKVKFSDLSNTKIKQIRQRSAKLRQEDNKILTNFLQDYNLSFAQYQAIKKVCQTTTKCKELFNLLLNQQKENANLLKSIEDIDKLESMKSEQDKIFNQFKSHKNLTATLSEQEYKIYKELFQKKPSYNFKKDKFKQLQLQQLKKKEKAIQNQLGKKQKELNEKQTIKGVEKSEEITEPKEAEQIEQTKTEAKVEEVKKQVKEENIVPGAIKDKKIEKALPQLEKTVKNQQQKTKKQSLSVDDHLFNAPNELAELQEELKDEDLNDIDIIDDDYEVLKLQQQIKKLGMSKIPAKKTNY